MCFSPKPPPPRVGAPRPEKCRAWVLRHTPPPLPGRQQPPRAIARPHTNPPGTLPADDPPGTPDPPPPVEVMNMFRERNRRKGLTVIIVTHDPKTAAFTDRAINMSDGLILEGVSEELSATLQK